MPNTTNYSFPTPADTDLVKNGADAIRDLGDAVDTAMNTALGTKKAGMVLLNTTSFSAVSSVSFAADTFTSTYSHYRILLDVPTLSINGNFLLRLRAAGTDNSASNYVYSTRGLQSNGSAFDDNSAGALTSFRIGGSSTNGIATMSIDLFNPKAAKKTSFNSLSTWQDGATASISAPYQGILTVSTSYDSATILHSAGNMTGTYSVYGYNI